MGKNVQKVSHDVLKLFYHYDWPGNIRELYNILERAMNDCRESILDTKYFKDFFADALVLKENDILEFEKAESPLNYVKDRAEKEAIIKALEICNQNRLKTARFLKISKSSLYNKMEKYHIE